MHFESELAIKGPRERMALRLLYYQVLGIAHWNVCPIAKKTTYLKNIMKIKTLPLLACCFASLLVSNAKAALPATPPDHIVVVIEENHGFFGIIGSTNAPYINSLTNSGTLFTNSHGITHPSKPN